MDNDSLQALRALLFGETPGGSPQALDFQVLLDLAPLLEEAALERVIEELSMMGLATRAQLGTLIALLGYLPGTRGEEILGQAVLQHAALLSFLPDDWIPRAVAGLRVVEPEVGYRADLVLALAKRLPLPDRQSLILEEALAAGRPPDLSRTDQRAIGALISGLAHPVPENAGLALYQRVSQWEPNDDRREALAVLAPLLPESRRPAAVSQVLGAIRAAESPVDRAEGLLRVAEGVESPQQESLLEEAFEAAREINLRNSKRLALLARISLVVPAAARAEVLAEALRPYHEEVFKWPSGEAALMQRFGEIAPTLAPDQVQALRTEIQKLPLPDNILDLSPLVPYLSESQYAAALARFPDPYRDEVMADAFTQLALHLPPGLLPEALARLASWEMENVKTQTLAAWIPGLPANQLPQVLEIAGSLESERRRARIAAALRARADWTDHAHPIFSLPAPGDRIRRLWAEMSGDQQEDLLAEILGRLWRGYGGMEAANGGGSEDGGRDSEDSSDEPVEEPSEIHGRGIETGGGVSFGGDVSIEGGDIIGRDQIIDGDVVGDTPVGEPSSGGKSLSPGEPSDNGDDLEDLSFEAPPMFIGDEEDSSGDGQDAGGEPEPGDKQPVVNTGFAPQGSPEAELSREQPLKQDERYYFWLHIGRQKKTAIAVESPEIDVSQLPPEAELTVALFGFAGEFEITPGADTGVVKLLPSRVVEVVKPAAEPSGLEEAHKLTSQLYFPVRTPQRAGEARLRCNLYYAGVLLQSHLITAWIGPAPPAGAPGAEGPALRHVLDYTLTNTLQAEIFTQLEKHSLSLLINDNGDGTHGFRFFGGENGGEVKGDAAFTQLELQDMIEQARGAMRKVSWDTKEDWTAADQYRYQVKRPPGWVDRLQGDLVRFAKWGARFYRLALQKLAESGAADLDEADRRKKLLEAAVRKAGRLQIAAKETSRHVLPAALIYDHLIHDALPSAMYRLCPEIRGALENGAPVQDTVCFQDECPHREDLQTVCPSGFWGYRHVLGFPVSIGEATPDLAWKIPFTEAPQMSALVSMDDGFKLRDSHIDRVRGLRAGLGWKFGDEGQEILDLMRQEHSHLVYFYCHGGLTEDGVPYLEVGPKGDVFGIITPTLLPNLQIKWDAPKPLVFINGCHTTALEPAKSLDLVTSFVKEARAVGVIGTEITIFEPLATAFGEACLAHFLNEVPIGDAIRRARLKLLQDGNPLGLVYIPYVVSSVRLAKIEADPD